VARAAEQRIALARHRQAYAAIYPRLKQAIFAAVEIQHEAIRAREAAIAELGEGICTVHLPHIAYNGLLLRDLVAMWTA
jgi:hypothetical protein